MSWLFIDHVSGVTLAWYISVDIRTLHYPPRVQILIITYLKTKSPHHLLSPPYLLHLRSLLSLFTAHPALCSLSVSSSQRFEVYIRINLTSKWNCDVVMFVVQRFVQSRWRYVSHKVYRESPLIISSDNIFACNLKCLHHFHWSRAASEMKWKSSGFCHDFSQRISWRLVGPLMTATVFVFTSV